MRTADYIHPDLDDLRHSQQAMTDYLLAQIKPKPGKGNRHGGDVVKFRRKSRNCGINTHAEILIAPSRRLWRNSSLKGAPE